MTATDTPLIVQHLDPMGICTLTLNSPKTRNALSRPMMQALLEALLAAGKSQEVKVVIIAANGPVFCAGHNLKELQPLEDPKALHGIFALCSELMQHIVHLPQPVIACVQGTATAAGCQLVASCDLAVTADHAHFATPGVNIGLFCSTPMVALSRNVNAKAAMEMLLTGEPISADEARAQGLVNRVVPAEELGAATRALAETIAGKAASTLKIGKQAFYRQRELSLTEAYRYTSDVMAMNMQTADAREGFAPFSKNARPVGRHSPTRQKKKGRTSDLFDYSIELTATVVRLISRPARRTSWPPVCPLPRAQLPQAQPAQHRPRHHRRVPLQTWYRRHFPGHRSPSRPPSAPTTGGADRRNGH